MKKGLIGLLGLISVSIITLASCGGNNNGANPMGTGSWGANEVSKNIEAQKEDNVPAEEVIPVNYTIAGEKVFDRKDIVSQEYAKYGLLAVRNDYGYVGFYSLNHNNWLLEKQYLEKVLNFDVVPDTYVGYFLRIIYDDILYVYDSLGNKVLESTKDNDCNYRDSICRISSSYINKKVYLTVIDEENTTTYYEYSSTGNISKISSLPQAQANVDNKEASPFAKNSKYIDLNKVDLKEYGLDGYYLSKKDELVTVFDKIKNIPVSTFTVPNGSTMVFVGNKLIYQNSYTVSEDEKNYSYYDGRNKYIVETYTVDLLNGEKKAINVAYKIENVFGPYMDKDGAYSYALISKRSFENNVLKSNEMVIIDSKGTIVSNLNGYEADDFVKIGTSYYNTVTKVLYDSTLKEIAYLEAINPKMMEKYNCFVGTVKNKYGIVNSNGNVAIPFDYTELYTDFIESGYVFGVKNEALYRVNIQTGNEELLGTIYKKYNNYIYIVDNSSNSFNIVFVKNNIKDNISADNYNTLGSLDSKLFDSNVIKFTRTLKNYYAQGKDYIEENFINVSKNVAPNKATYVAQGTEITSNAKLGEEITEAETITTGINKMYITSANGNYFKFVPTEDGYYNLPSYYKDYTVSLSVQLYTPADPEILNSKPTYSNLTVNKETYGNIVRLEKGKTYYFKVSTNYTAHGTVYLDLEMEKGEHSKYPIFHKLTDTQTFDYFETGTYIQLFVKGGGYYKLNNPSVMYYTLLNDSQYIPAGYNQGNSLNQTTKNNNTYFQLNEFSTYLIKVSSYSTMDSFRFGISYETDEKLNPTGSSVIKPFVLTAGNNNVSFDNLNYYKYHCTKDCELRLSSTNRYVFNGNSSYAYIYEGEYNPNDQYNYNYTRITNGGTFEAKANTDYYIRINQGNINTTDFVLNVEEITNEIENNSVYDANDSGTDFIYFKPTSDGIYTVALEVSAGDKLIGYDLYNKKIYEETAIEAGHIAYSHYLYSNAVYKFVRSTEDYNQMYIAKGSVMNQYLVEDLYNTAYFSSSYSNTKFIFKPTEAGTYSFAIDNNAGNLYTFSIVDDKNNVIDSIEKENTYTYRIATFEAGKTYKITAQALSYGVKNIRVTKEYGQNWIAPITLNAMEEFNATEFLKKTGKTEADLYVKVYFPKAASIKFNGFDKYDTSYAEPYNTLGSSRSVNDGSTYYLHATIDSTHTKVSTSLYNDENVAAGSSIYKPTKVTTGPLSGTATADDESIFYQITNSGNADKFIEFDESSVTNIANLRIYDENYNEVYGSADRIFLMDADTTYILEVVADIAGDYAINYELTDVSSYALANETLTLNTETPKKEIKLISAKSLYVKVKALSTSEEDPNPDTITITIKNSAGTVLGTIDSVDGVASISYKFSKLLKYTIEFEGEGTFTITYDYTPYTIDCDNETNTFAYDEENGTYTSTNTNMNSNGTMTITVDSNMTLSFDLLLSCGTNDTVYITRKRGTSTTTLNYYYGYGNEGDNKLSRSYSVQKGDVITIRYTRSNSIAYNDNNVVVSNIGYNLENEMV